MKQQFLDLNGLTELVTYLKKSITEQKEILPYASNKLFPSTGNVNTIYIDTATNSIYRWDSSNKKYEILAKAVKSVSISESTENGKITLTVDGNKTTVPIHGLGSAAFTNALCGITEPGLYGIILRSKWLLGTMVFSGAAAGLVFGIGGVAATNFAFTGILAFSGWLGCVNFPMYCVGIVVAIALGFGITAFLLKSGKVKEYN